MPQFSRPMKVFLFFSLSAILILFFSDQLFYGNNEDVVLSEEKKSEKKNTQKDFGDEVISEGGEKDPVSVISGEEIYAQNALVLRDHLEKCFDVNLQDFDFEEIKGLRKEALLNLLSFVGQVVHQTEDSLIKTYDLNISEQASANSELSGQEKKSLSLQNEAPIKQRQVRLNSIVDNDEGNMAGKTLTVLEKNGSEDWQEIPLNEEQRFDPSANFIASYENEGVLIREEKKERFYFSLGDEVRLHSINQIVDELVLSRLQKTLKCQKMMTLEKLCECAETIVY